MSVVSRTSIQRADRRDERLVLRDGRRYVIIPQRDVSWIQADGNYVVVHAGPRTVRTRAALSAIMAVLGPAFVQVHRSAVVNLEHLVELRSEPHGDLELVLRDGASLRGSRVYRARVYEYMSRGPGLATLGRSA